MRIFTITSKQTAYFFYIIVSSSKHSCHYLQRMVAVVGPLTGKKRPLFGREGRALLFERN